jgi:hypothetical protein
MPPFFLILILLVAGKWFTQVFVLIPLEFLSNFSLPRWLTLAVLAVVLSWCFGE